MLSEVDSQIEQYVRWHVKEDNQENFSRCVATVKLRMESIMANWILQVAKAAKAGDSSTKLSSSKPIDCAAVGIVCSIFQKNYPDVKLTGELTKSDSRQKSYFGPAFPNGNRFSIACNWSDDSFLSHQTVILLSKSGEEILAPLSIFQKCSSEAAKIFFTEDIEEGEKLYLNYSSEVIKKFVKFFLEDRIGRYYYDELFMLLELSYTYEIHELSTYCLEIIREDLNERTFSSDQIESLLKLALPNKIDDFIIRCLADAEEREIRAETNSRLSLVDWSQIDAKYYDELIAVCKEKSFQFIERTLLDYSNGKRT